MTCALEFNRTKRSRLCRAQMHVRKAGLPNLKRGWCKAMVHDNRSTVLDVDGDSKEQLSDIVINLGVTLPAWFMWPNLSTGNWKDCYAVS